MHKIILALALFIGLSTSAVSQNYYSVKFPDDYTVVSCGGTADTIWPQITYYGGCNFNVGISVKDQVFSLNNTGGCKKILRTWKLVWWCDYNPNWPGPTYIENPGSTDVGPTVMANSSNHGYLQYTQIIKIVDNVPPTYLGCPTGTVLFCDYTNNDPAQYGARCEGPVNLKMKVTDVCSKSDLIVTYRLYLDLDGNGSMETFRSSSAPDAWPIEKTITADTVSAKIKLPTGVGLPYGKHKIEWITNDRCGNEALCKYEFEVRDCKPPTVVCINGLSINIMSTGMITLWATDFLQYATDNCTPAEQIKIAIRKAGTGTGFPTGNTSVTFDCNEIGKQNVEIWAQDAYGNADYCQTYVIVQDHIGACTPPGPITGSIVNDQQQPLPGAKILLKSNLTGVGSQSNSLSNALGQYAFSGAPGTCNYSIIPALDTLPLLGVTTLDVLLTDLHMTGQALLPSPYRIIAADANHDGLLSTADLDAMNNLILGTATKFPNNTAWRFVPAAFTFPNPLQPLAGIFPEKISTTCPAPAGTGQNFVAIKTGDVDGSTPMPPQFTAGSSARAEGENFVIFHAAKRRFEAGETVEVTLRSPELGNLAGFQFTLEADPNLLALQSATPGSMAPRMGVWQEQNRVSASWYSTTGTEGEQTVMTLIFTALQAGTLSQALHLGSSVTNTEAYDRSLSKLGATLQFDAPETGFARLFPVTPNPTSGPVAAAFFLPEAGEATLTLLDLNGKPVASHSAYFEKGNHRIELATGAATGLLFLHLQTENGTDVQRVVKH